MLSVSHVDSGVVEINWSWLPVFIVMDAGLMKRLDKSVIEKFSGRELSNDLLSEMHAYVIDEICDHFKDIHNLRLLFDGLHHVTIGENNGEKDRDTTVGWA